MRSNSLGAPGTAQSRLTKGVAGNCNVTDKMSLLEVSVKFWEGWAAQGILIGRRGWRGW